MKSCTTMSCLQLEQQVIDYLIDNPKSSIEDIADYLDIQYMAVRRILEGRNDSRSHVGLVDAGYVRVIPGTNRKNNLCWLYEVC